MASRRETLRDEIRRGRPLAVAAATKNIIRSAMTKKILAVVAVLLMTAAAVAQNTARDARPRASGLGLKVGILPTGPLDAITDVGGVEVGHTTIIRGDD